MSFFDTSILIENVSIQMKKHHITQEKLAEILGMSQPNVSKALSPTDKKCFTLDQVVGIANHFGVSIDKLVGNGNKNSQSTDMNPRAIAEFLSKIIESNDAKYLAVNVEEEVFTPEHTDRYGSTAAHNEKQTISYNAFYLPSYWKLPDLDTVGRDTFDEEFYIARQIGNETRMKPVNDFFHKYIQIYEIYKKGDLDDDIFHAIVNKYLVKIPDFC